MAEPVRRSSSGYQSLTGGQITRKDLAHRRRINFFFGKWKDNSHPINLDSEAARNALPENIRTYLNKILQSYLDWTPWKHMRHDVYIHTTVQGGIETVTRKTNYIRMIRMWLNLTGQVNKFEIQCNL